MGWRCVRSGGRPEPHQSGVQGSEGAQPLIAALFVTQKESVEPQRRSIDAIVTCRSLAIESNENGSWNGTRGVAGTRGAWDASIPSTVSILKSDDTLKYEIIARAVFLDFGITDAITDKHRNYASNFVIPMARVE